MRHWYSEDKPTPHGRAPPIRFSCTTARTGCCCANPSAPSSNGGLSAIGYQPTDSIPEDTLQLYLPQLLTCRSPGGKVCFERINLSRDSVMRIDDILVKYYFEK